MEGTRPAANDQTICDQDARPSGAGQGGAARGHYFQQGPGRRKTGAMNTVCRSRSASAFFQSLQQEFPLQIRFMPGRKFRGKQQFPCKANVELVTLIVIGFENPCDERDLVQHHRIALDIMNGTGQCLLSSFLNRSALDVFACLHDLDSVCIHCSCAKIGYRKVIKPFRVQ